MRGGRPQTGRGTRRAPAPQISQRSVADSEGPRARDRPAAPTPKRGGSDVCRVGARTAGRTSQRRRDYNRSTTLRRVPMDSWAGGESERWPWGEWADAEPNQGAWGSVQATDASRGTEASRGWITSSSGRTGRTVAPIAPQDRVEPGPHRGPRGVVSRTEGTVLATSDASEVEASEGGFARD